MTVWGMRVLASLAGTRSASSLPFHWKITILSFHSKPKENCRNPNLDQEHEFSRGIGGTNNPFRVKASVEAPWPLVSFGLINQAIFRLAQVRQGQTRSNMAKPVGQTRSNKAKQGQTRPNNVKWGHLFSSASWWWRCPLLQPCACCLQASLCPENERYSKIVFCNFRYWPFPSSSFQIHQWDRHSPSYPWAPRYYPESMWRVKLYKLLSWSCVENFTSSPKPRHLRRYSVLPFLPTLLSITWREEEATTVGKSVLKPFPRWIPLPCRPCRFCQQIWKRPTAHLTILTLEGSDHNNAGVLSNQHPTQSNILWSPWLLIIKGGQEGPRYLRIETGLTLDHILTQFFKPSYWPQASADCSAGCSTCPAPRILQNPRCSGQVPTPRTP